MIITKLIGGLGNQMFQYAAGRRAAYVNNTLLKLDITGYENQEGITPREYMLHIFNIRDDFAKPEEIRRLKGSDGNFFARFLSKLPKRLVSYRKHSYIIQKYFQFDPDILKVTDNVYLEGFWANEKYFKDIENIIRKDFAFKYSMNHTNEQMAGKIKITNSVSLHVRRGDYVTNKRIKQFHGNCGLDYYRKVISIISKRIKNPTFFVFSDDPDWAKQNLKIGYSTNYIDFNKEKKDFEDMRLMSLCKHNIIANSTFSWWGAWLNKNTDKIVVAPKKWFADKTIKTGDLIPSSWLRI